jgi:hypothetical protein
VGGRRFAEREGPVDDGRRHGVVGQEGEQAGNVRVVPISSYWPK